MDTQKRGEMWHLPLPVTPQAAQPGPCAGELHFQPCISLAHTTQTQQGPTLQSSQLRLRWNRISHTQFSDDNEILKKNPLNVNIKVIDSVLDNSVMPRASKMRLLDNAFRFPQGFQQIIAENNYGQPDTLPSVETDA